jgi:hypothetical protein
MGAKAMHDFHFIMDRDMKERLKNVEGFQESRGVSSVIVRILKILSPVIRREHVWGEQRLSRYRAVCNDPDVMRDHLHVYIPEELYRELKLLHQDLNFFSIAQMVRDFLEWFLEFARGYEGDAFVELEKIFSQWSKEKTANRLTLREYVRQLFRILRHLPEKNRLVNIYNSDFSPFWILRM